MAKLLYEVPGVLLIFLATTCFAQGTNWCEDANVQGCWEMETSNDTEQDLSSNNEDLTDNNTVPTSSTAKGGSYSRNFNGSTEFLHHNDAGSTEINGADQSISMCAWARPDTTTSNHAIMGKARYQDNDRQYELYIQDNTDAENVVCMLGDAATGSTSTYAITADNTIADGNWYHLCCVYNDTDIRIYINGTVCNNGADCPKAYVDGIYNSDNPFRVGAVGDAGWTGHYFDGLIDSAVIFNDELSAAEVAEIYNYGLTGGRRIFITN